MSSATLQVLYASLLGQSNVSELSVRGPDGSSGVVHLQAGLLAKSGFSQVSITNSAVGASTVDGDSHDRPLKTWWFPDENQPGYDLLQAVDVMNNQIASLGGVSNVKPIVIWGQGEAEANSLGTPKTEAGRQAEELRYLNATQSVFNYIHDHVNQDIQFYIMETGRFNTTGAINADVPQYLIDKVNLGLKYVDDAQVKLAQTDSYVHLAVNYNDLSMFADMPTTSPGYKSSWATDTWHLSYPSKEIIGDRLAAFISSDLGAAPVPPPAPTLYGTKGDDTIYGGSGGGFAINGGGGNDSLYAAGGGNTLNGGTGNDNLHAATGNNTLYGNDGNDTLYAGAGNDLLYGNNGNDVLIAAGGSTAMTGGGGADIFKFLSVNGVADKISDFHSSIGDKIDLSNILQNFDPVTESIANFVHATRTGDDTMISVDPLGGAHFTPLALLQGVHGFDPQTMLANGNLVG